MFYFFITIVFISELIITIFLTVSLLKADKTLREANLFVEEAKPKIRYIMKISNKISEQLVELAPIWREKVKNTVINFALSNVKSFLIGIAFYSLKKRWKIKRIKGAKLIKFIRFLTV